LRSCQKIIIFERERGERGRERDERERERETGERDGREKWEKRKK
jgi:hypothetical protein